MPQNKTQFKRQRLHEHLADTLLLKPDDGFDESLNHEIVTNNISVEGRLDIYRNNVLGGMIEVILERYSLITKLVGEEFARAMARDYILQSPPQFGNLNIYGQDYPDFIRTFAPAKEFPYLVDIAQLENLEHLAYYAPDSIILSLENASEYLPKILEGSLSIALASSVQILKSEFPVLSLKNYIEAGSEDEFDMGAAGETVCVWRLGYKVEYIKLKTADYIFLKSVMDGKGLNKALESSLIEENKFNFETFWAEMLNYEVFTITDIK